MQPLHPSPRKILQFSVDGTPRQGPIHGCKPWSLAAAALINGEGALAKTLDSNADANAVGSSEGGLARGLQRFDSILSLALRGLARQPGLAALLVLAIAAAAILPGLFDLPPIDRTEVRYAQISKQMLETGEWIAPRLQSEPQFTRPIGIFWLQGLSASLLGEDAQGSIWAYRLPSALCALLAVLVTYLGARRGFGREAALLGALLLAVNLIVVLQAHLALTKAIHLLFVVIAQWSLARAYVQPDGTSGPRDAALFWGAQGLGILAGALALVLLSLTTILGLIAADRGFGWLKRLRPLWGVPLMLAMASPWAIALALNPEPELVAATWGDGFLSKIAGPQEMNYRALPGIFVVGSWLGLLPGVIFLPMAIAYLWKNRAEAPQRFLLAWIFAYLLALEALSGKPPLYSMQSIMPAILMAVAMMVAGRAVTMPEKFWARRLNGGFALLHDALPALGLMALLIILAPPAWALAGLLGILALIAVGLAIFAALSNRPHASIGLSILGALAVYWGAFQFALPSLERVWLSPRLGEVARAVEPCVPGAVALAGYSEPSAIFVLGTDTYDAKGPQGGAPVADWLRKGTGKLAFVSARAEPAFRTGLESSRFKNLEPIACVRGLNFGRFQWIDMKLYTSADPQSLGACPIPEFARCPPPTGNPPQ